MILIIVNTHKLYCIYYFCSYCEIFKVLLNLHHSFKFELY